MINDIQHGITYMHRYLHGYIDMESNRIGGGGGGVDYQTCRRRSLGQIP